MVMATCDRYVGRRDGTWPAQYRCMYFDLRDVLVYISAEISP